MFDLEQPFLICYYSLSWGIDHGIIAALFASDCVFPFIFFYRQLSATWIIISNFMSLRFKTVRTKWDLLFFPCFVLAYSPL